MKNIKLSNFSNVYILSPYFQTGGPELLHQLCDALRMGGINACIVYVDANYKFFEASIIPAYQKYNVQTSVFIEDSRENVVVFPEIFFPISKRYERVQKLFWWLSVDSYFNSCSTFSFPYLKFIGFRQYLRNFKNKYRSLIKSHMSLNEGTMSLREIKNSLALNACQSFYAKTFLCKNGIENSVLLRDYINTEFVRTVHDNIKKNQILYNPKKGFNFTKRVIEKLPTYKFIRLEGLSREQLANLMQESKLYIDFGNHPGQDRLPRECALNGCCLITGRKGAANFYEDIPIPDEYKFDEKKDKIDSVVDKIKEVLENYDKKKCDFDFYRESIGREKEVFLNQINEIFGLK